ncbi:hypothetical protein ACJ73_08832, partial [Blastomyces percursus]
VRIADQSRPSPVGGDSEAAPQPPTPSRSNLSNFARRFQVWKAREPWTNRIRILQGERERAAHDGCAHMQLQPRLRGLLAISVLCLRSLSHHPCIAAWRTQHGHALPDANAPMRLQLARVHIPGVSCWG